MCLFTDNPTMVKDGEQDISRTQGSNGVSSIHIEEQGNSV